MTRNEYTPRLEGDLDAGQHQIYNLPAPVSDSQAANKAYVDAGGGGGSQTVNMVGPVSIAWDDAGIGNSPGLEVCEVAVGSVVLGVYFIPTDDWDGGAGQTYIQATSVISIGGGGGRDIAAWDLLDAKATHSDVLQAAPLNLSVGNTLLFHGGLPLQADATVNVHVITDGAGLHVGAADVYALIGTPAA